MLQDVWTAINGERFDDAERLLARDPDLRDSPAGRMALGYLQTLTARWDDARATYTAVRNHSAERGDRALEHIALHRLGIVERGAGAPDAALGLFEQERTLIDDADDHALAMNAARRGETLLALGRHDEAGAALREAADLARAADDPEALGVACRALGDLALARDDAKGARRAYAEARAAFEEAEDEAALRDLARREA